MPQEQPPKFDPKKPFTKVVDEQAPAFDPTKPAYKVQLSSPFPDQPLPSTQEPAGLPTKEVFEAQQREAGTPSILKAWDVAISPILAGAKVATGVFTDVIPQAAASYVQRTAQDFAKGIAATDPEGAAKVRRISGGAENFIQSQKDQYAATVGDTPQSYKDVNNFKGFLEYVGVQLLSLPELPEPHARLLYLF